MKNNLYLFKKILLSVLLGVVLITSTVSSINGNVEKTNLQITNENLTNFFLNDDYINGYWKFDECSGSTAYDSSGHGYDGTIYGASWVSSGSGCALDFDGVDDYVDFNDYAQNLLGFNKTDDLIFSFNFMSSSTDKSILYSSCRGDSYGYNPGFHIALKSDGRFEVQLWRLNCGILMNSTETYNDGYSHYVEIYYNGISSNPMVEIYVDGTLDSTYEKYVCSFYADQFYYAEIGRNSHEHTDYYDGRIDHFKITKYPGGNEQNPPIIDGPRYGLPAVEYDFSFTTVDPEGDNISLIIDWGDGNIEELNGSYQSGEDVIVSHIWEEEGVYNISARSIDRCHHSSWSEPYEVSIGNRPPGITTIQGPKSGDIDQEITYTFVAEDPEGQTVQYFIDWGDSNTEWTALYDSGEEVYVTHAWNAAGDYIITAYAKDELDAEGPWSEPYYIRIGNQPPDIPIIDGPVEGDPGKRYPFTFLSEDPEGDNIKYEIKWGDGTEEETDYQISGETITVRHSWPVSGNYTISARACDTFGSYSNWSEYNFKAPRCKTLSLNFLDWLFTRFPIAFIIIKNI